MGISGVLAHAREKRLGPVNIVTSCLGRIIGRAAERTITVGDWTHFSLLSFVPAVTSDWGGNFSSARQLRE